MSHHCLSASVPQHIYGYVASEILHGLDPNFISQFEPCVIIGITSVPSRALMFEIMTEKGAKWARIPIHMLFWEKPAGNAPRHELPDLQCWDCHGWDFATVQFEYLREMGCEYRTPDGVTLQGHYWFTLDHTDNGYSQYPPEHKNYNLIKLEDGSGQIAAMPNNRILWHDDSFVSRPSDWKPDYKTMAPVTWHAEEGRRNPQETAMTRDVE